MNRTQVVTLRMPKELKKRLEQEAQHQGVSLNQLTNYLLNIQLTQLEMLSSLEKRLASKNLKDLKEKVHLLLDRVPDRDVPEWDRVD